MTQIRIYYECYEQAAHFIAPIIQRINPTAKVEFLRLTSIKKSSVIAKRLAAGLALKNPDLVVSLIHRGEEYGLAWIEISTAVDTQDHDLQRFDSIVACSFANAPFVKIWARRTSPNNHGGQLNYDKLLSLKVGRQMLGIPTLELEWPLNPTGKQALRHPKFLACPIDDLGLFHVLNLAIEGVETQQSSTYFFLKNCQTETWLKAMLDELARPIGTYQHGRSSRLFKDSHGAWTLKFNRWGHAMDPERGMAWFYAALFKCKLRGQLWDKEASSTPAAIANFSAATGLDLSSCKGSGPFNINESVLKSEINSAGRAILANCCSFEIFDKEGLKKLAQFTWTVDFWGLLNNSAKTDSLTHALAFTKTEEDDVTYAVACSVYPLNGFKVDSVSYPGAQGDRALLEGSGRSVRRTYIDVIAEKQVDGKRLVALTESKGKNSPSVLSDDATKVSGWRDDPKKRGILSATLGNGKVDELIVSVAAPGLEMRPFPNASKVDFVVTVDFGKWIIWPRAGRIPSGFKVLEGSYPVENRFTY
jgi:hypothetical protein